VARLPDFVIIGSMKCGTSSLFEQLALRSGLFMSEPKEPNFFSDDANYARGLGSYTALFAGARPDQLCGEGSTHYTKLPTFPATIDRLKRHLERPKLIYMMRDPVERIASQYIHEWTQKEVRGSFEKAVRQHERYVAYSSYARQLEPYLRAFGPESVLPVFLERVKRSPTEEFARVCSFIGDPTPAEPVWCEDLGPQNVSRDRLRQSGFREAVLSLPGARRAKDLLPERVKQRIKASWQISGRPTLPAQLAAEVTARLDADLARLGSWLGRELTCRGWREQVKNEQAAWTADAPARG